MRRKPNFQHWLLMGGVIAVSGCVDGTSIEDAGIVGALIELEDGGFDDRDEAPAFGEDTDELEEIDVELGEPQVSGPLPPMDACDEGAFAGKWERLEEGRGRFIGRVVNSDRETIGHIRGIYGRRYDRRQLFFGKYINTEGHFRGLFRGDYGSGRMTGRWAHRSDERGVLRGEYRGAAEDGAVGRFRGRWSETTCDR